jgi:hypothetical protein
MGSAPTLRKSRGAAGASDPARRSRDYFAALSVLQPLHYFETYAMLIMDAICETTIGKLNESEAERFFSTKEASKQNRS